MNKQNRNILTVARWEWDWQMGEKGERIKKYKLGVIEQSWECNLEHREGGLYSNGYVWCQQHARFIRMITQLYNVFSLGVRPETNIIMYVNSN